MKRGQIILTALGLVFVMACSQSKQAQDNAIVTQEQVRDEVDSARISDRLIIKLAEGTQPNDLVKKYTDIDLQLVKEIAPRLSLYLFSYDTDKAVPEELIRELRTLSIVLQAEFDKELEMRE